MMPTVDRRAAIVAPIVPLRPPSLDGPSLERALRIFNLYRLLCTSYLFTPIVVRFFHARGLDFTHITLLNTVYALTAILFEVPTGILADRFGRARAMLLGALLMALGCMVDYSGLDFWSFAVGEGLLALGMTLTSGADSAYLWDLLTAAGRTHEYRRWEGSATAAKMMGAALALLVGGWIGARSLPATYSASAAVCALAALFAFMLPEPPVGRTQSMGADQGLWPTVVAAARTVLGRRPLLFAVGFSVFLFTLLRMGLYLHPTWLEVAGFSTEATGFWLAILSVVGALGAQRIEAVRRVVGERRLVWVLPLVLSLSYAGLGASLGLLGLVLLAAQSLVNGIFSPLSKELLNREIVDSGQRATVLSVESMARRLLFGAFAPVAGLVMDRQGSGAGLWACAAGALVGGLLLFGWSRVIRAPSDAEGAPAPLRAVAGRTTDSEPPRAG